MHPRFSDIMKHLTAVIAILLSFIHATAQNEIVTADDNRILGWADSCQLNRGHINMTDTSTAFASFGAGTDGYGPADGQIVSLGDHGQAVLTFSQGITNGPGIDFAVFENAIYSPPGQDSMLFAELAFVEVSSDGEHYVRFPAVSQTDNSSQLNSFEPMDYRNVYNLAGATASFSGCGFDLADVKDSINIDTDHITHIRLIDVGGNINPEFASYDSEGNIINDPWPTEYASCGFDLDAIAVIHNSTGTEVQHQKALTIFPNPVLSVLHIEGIR